MKKLINPIPSGGMPVFGTESLSEILSVELWTAAEAMLGTLLPSKYSTLIGNNNMVLIGGEPTSLGGGLFDISAGIAYFPDSLTAPGAIAAFPAATGVNPGLLGSLSIDLGAPITEQKTFADAGVKDYAITYSAVVDGAAAASTDRVVAIITSDTSRFPSLQWILDSIAAIAASDLAASLGGIALQKYAIGTWDMNTVPSVTIPITGVSTSTFISAEAWIREDDTLSTRWRKINWTQDGTASGDIEVRGNAGGEAVDGMDVLLDSRGIFASDANYSGTVVDRGYILIHYDNS